MINVRRDCGVTTEMVIYRNREKSLDADPVEQLVSARSVWPVLE